MFWCFILNKALPLPLPLPKQRPSRPACRRLLTRRTNDSTTSYAKRRTYAKAIATYTSFCNSNFPNTAPFLATAASLATYIAHLYSEGYAPTAMLSHMSALSYIHKLSGDPDHSQNFAIKKLITGAQNLSGRLDTRLPITTHVLGKIVQALKFVASSQYLRLSLKSTFLLAFHAFLRIGEITTHGHQCYVIQLEDISFSLTGFSLTISRFKHNSSRRPVTLSIAASGDECCPVAALKQFKQVRGLTPGPLFSFADASPVSRNCFCRYLRDAVQWADFDANKYKTHSFRIGAATTAADMGMSELQHQSMGR